MRLLRNIIFATPKLCAFEIKNIVAVHKIYWLKRVANAKFLSYICMKTVTSEIY